MIEQTSLQLARSCLGDACAGGGQLTEKCVLQTAAENAIPQPPSRTPQQLADLLKYTTLDATDAPDRHYEQVWGDACALYEALGHRLEEPRHEGVDGW